MNDAASLGNGDLEEVVMRHLAAEQDALSGHPAYADDAVGWMSLGITACTGHYYLFWLSIGLSFLFLRNHFLLRSFFLSG
jgi:hypothetical protein